MNSVSGLFIYETVCSPPRKLRGRFLHPGPDSLQLWIGRPEDGTGHRTGNEKIRRNVPSVLARPRVGRWSFVEDYCRKFLLFFFHCAEVTFFFASAQEENAPWVPFSSEPCSVGGFTFIPVRQLLVAILLRAFGLWGEMVKWFEMFVGEHFSNHLLGRVGTSCFMRF